MIALARKSAPRNCHNRRLREPRHNKLVRRKGEEAQTGASGGSYISAFVVRDSTLFDEMHTKAGERLACIMYSR